MRRMPELDRIENHTFIADLLQPNATVIDLGANRGLFASQILARYGCRVVSAEPVLDLFEGLPKDDKLLSYRVALGGTRGQTLINVHRDRCASVITDATAEVAHVEDVDQLDFAGFLTLAGVERVDLLKVDIEGAELDMFEAMEGEDFRRIHQITVEFHDFIFAETSDRVRRTRARLRRAGFAEFRFSRRNTDVLYVRANLITPLQSFVLSCAGKYWAGLRRTVSRKWRESVAA